MLLLVFYLNADDCRCLSQDLLKLETFYSSLGGLLGYQLRSLQLLSAAHSDNGVEGDASVEYLMPRFLDLSTSDDRVKAAVRSGIQAIPYMAEIYALGGSGDRLGLQCPESGHLLPSAMLPYCGRSMLDSMIRDLQVWPLCSRKRRYLVTQCMQARESLYFRLTGEQHTTPIVIMTSDAKENDRRIREMLISQNWYGRGQDSFFIFKQPLVPLIDITSGAWLVTSPGKVDR